MQFLILAATLCWAVEVVVSRHVLQRGVGGLLIFVEASQTQTRLQLS